MIAKMADGRQEESLKCVIHKFAVTLPYENVRTMQMCQRKRILYVSNADFSLDVVRLEGQELNSRRLASSTQFLVCPDLSSFSGGRLICLKDTSCLQCYDNASEIMFECDIREILNKQDQEMDTEKLHLCRYQGDYLTLTLPIELIILQTQKDSFKFISTIPLEDSTQTFNKYQILSEYVLVLKGNSLEITLYSMEKGDVIAKLNLSRMNIDFDRLLLWQFTPDLKYLVIIENTFTVTCYYIESYVQKFPECVTRTLTQKPTVSDNEVLNTVHVGDSIWKKQLLSIHDRNTVEHSSPLWYIYRQNDQQSKRRRKWIVSGFIKGKDKKFEPDRSSELSDKKIFLPAVLNGMNIVDIVVGTVSMAIHLQSPKENIVCICDIQKQIFSIQRLPYNCFVMLSHEPQFPHLVATETYLTCIIPCIEQEDFVSKMMTYAGASIADLLCHMNKWGRCSLPLHTLETGVKHRQLDTVVFFLKSKENLFSSHKTMISSPTSPTGPSNHHDNIVQLQPALQLLIQSIQDNLNDSQSRDFVKRLSEITLEFLYEILSDALDVQTAVKTKFNKNELEDISRSIDIVLEDIAEVRQCVRRMEEGAIEEESRVHDSVDGGKENVNVVIEEALLSNNVPTVQANLMERGDNSFAKLDYIVNTSIARAVKYLSEKQTKPAIAIFSNLGMNVNNKMWEIASVCEDSSIRNFIIEELSGRKCLSEDQLEVIKFVKDFEGKYPQPSFPAAVEAARKQEVPPDRIESVFMSLDGSPSFDLTSECGDLSPWNRVCSGERSGRYGHVLLDWVQKWDHETRQLILMKDDPEEVQLLHLRYLLRYNKLDRLLSWIQGADDTQIPIMHQLLGYLHECTGYVRLILMEAMASKGVFLNTEDFNKTISQLALVGGVLKLPHPFVNQSSSEIDDFHKNCLHYCIQNSLPNVMWQYCSIHKISHKLLKSIIEKNNDCAWLVMFVSMFRLQQKPKDFAAMVEASLSNSRLAWKLDQSSITEIMKKGELLTAMATIMYSQNKLQQLCGDKKKLPLIQGLENSELEAALQPYPKLHSALFPAHDKDLIQNDVTVYQLLLDNAPFDPRKLFGWQSVNNLASDESPKVMPYFSQPDLMTKYGYVEKIRYMYYLQQGRPSFAFVSFLAEASDMEPTGITPQRISEAASTALWIGVKNFSNAQISCTCVVFTEMLGQDTSLLRTYLQVGNEILSHLNSTVTGNSEKKKELSQKNEMDVVSWITACVLKRGKHARLVLSKLEEAILFDLDKKNINRTSFEAGQIWTIAVLFCHLLQIPLSTKYLELTAKCDKWLPFLWFSQMHQYPKEQLQSLLYHFKSPHLQQHLHYVIENAEAKVQGSKSDDRSSDKGKPNREIRSTLYSRIGVAKEATQEKSSSEDEADTTESTQPAAEGDDTDFMLTDSEAISEDLFTVVFHSQSSRCPWKYLLGSGIAAYNPILIELASCLENANLVTCMCGWLVAMMDQQEHDRYLEDHGKAMWKWNTKHLNQLIDVYLSRRWNKTLMTGFHIFIPECTILPFLRFSAEFIDSRNYTQCRIHFQEYKDAVSMAHSERQEDSIESALQQDIFHDQDWLQQTTYKILYHHMTNTANLFHLLQLMKILDTESAVLLFKFEVPDFGMLHRLLNILVNNQISDLNVCQFLGPKEQFVTECQRVISLLVNKQLYQPARDFCNAGLLGSEQVTLAEVRYRKDKLKNSSVWKSGLARQNFWRKCSKIMKENKADSIISQFYQEEAEDAEDLMEKSFLYQLCIEHLETAKDPPSYSELYRKMWLCRLQAKIETREKPLQYTDDDFPVLELTKQQLSQNDLLCFGKMPSKVEMDASLNLKEANALGAMLNDLLDKGQVNECCHLSAEFKLYSQDLTIILTCIRLALGEVSLKENMDMDMVSLVAGGPGKLHRASVSSPAMVPKSSSGNLLVPMGPITYSTFGIEMEKVVSTMETLSSHCNHGNHFCKQIINCFIISLVLGTSYENVVRSEEFDILRSLLETDFPHKVKLAGDYLTNSSLSPNEVAGFLSGSFVKSYQVKHGLLSLENKSELMFNDFEGSVSQFIKLCPDPSLLGDRILEAVTTLSVDQDLLSSQVLAMQTDLLILAHSCHTVACNMEGISNVLRAARALTSCLQSTQQFTLMVQLLTGIGRFGEMTYIFDSIKQHDQFELLLKKGIDRENNLKLAILDYLKRYHPNDKETYDMVAHNFMLHRQIAQTLEARAVAALDSLKNKPLENTPEVQNCLQTVIQYFTDAAESYSKEKCVRHAQKCIRQARLVALQLHHLSSGSQLLHLTDDQADNVISKHPKFLEALILSQSYGRKACWPDAICYNVILNGDFRYLQDFKQHLKLTPTQIREAVFRYQQSPNKTSSSLGNLKKLLTYCKDIDIQYNLAMEFSLKDLVTSLENGDSWAYIKDIMANKE